MPANTIESFILPIVSKTSSHQPPHDKLVAKESRETAPMTGPTLNSCAIDRKTENGEIK